MLIKLGDVAALSDAALSTALGAAQYRKALLENGYDLTDPRHRAQTAVWSRMVLACRVEQKRRARKPIGELNRSA